MPINSLLAAEIYVEARVIGNQEKYGLQLERCEPAMLAEHECGDPRQVRCGEAITRIDSLADPGPGHPDAYAAGEKINRRRGVVVKSEGVSLIVAGDRDDRREYPREADDRHVVRRGHERRPPEVGTVGQLA
jgi:hypothetical protein